MKHLEDLTVKELRQAAKELNIKGRSKMNKAEYESVLFDNEYVGTYTVSIADRKCELNDKARAVYNRHVSMLIFDDETIDGVRHAFFKLADIPAGEVKNAAIILLDSWEE